MQFSKDAGGAGAVDNPVNLKFDPGDEIYVKVNKDNCKISYNGAADVAAVKDTWHGFTIPKDYHSGANTIRATYFSETVASAFYVIPPDTTPPVVLLKLPSVPVKQGSTAEELIESLKDNLVLYDNVTPPADIITDFDVSKIDLAKRGSNYAWVTATDEAGNKSEPLDIPVRVYGADEIVATVNGQTAFPDGMVYLQSTAVAVELFNLPAGEPYSVKLKDGIKTVAQMKYYATTVPSTGGKASFTLPQKGEFYTLYVRSQGRQELIFNIFVSF
jgi:hypothetical protein